MLTLYHSPMSRSTRITQLLRELNALDRVNVEIVTVTRIDGSGGIDPANPHPEGKVPLLVHDGAQVRESNAVMLYLTDHFADSPLGRPVGHPSRGAYLSWLAWYGNVFEPVYLAQVGGIDSPVLTHAIRDVPTAVARLSEALRDRDYLVDDAFSAADILVCSTYAWFPKAVPEDAAIRAWVKRCLDRPAMTRVWAEDMARAAA